MGRAAGEGSARVSEVDIGFEAETFLNETQPQMRAEAALAHAALFPGNEAAYGPGIRRLVQLGLETTGLAYLQAVDLVAQARREVTARLQDVDALLLPTAPTTAPDIASTGSGIFCGLASFTGLPSISLPTALDTDGLPLALQLIGAPLGEAALLGLADWVERQLDFHAEPEL